uniref:Uncharacterized protein n=1 Tax=Tanacetum cinerariifolium TaxID=118510 RepID=A0A6L2MA86_TANCI|nr:hypothetical protein [Tanacetum cinerariifolium]
MLAIQAEEGEGSGHPSKPQPPPSTAAQPTNEEPILDVVSSSHQKTQTPRKALNKVTELPQTSEPIPNVADEAVYEEWDDRVERAATTAASLDAEQESGNINRTQSTVMPNVPFPQGIIAGGVHTPRSNEAIFAQHELTGNVQQQSNDPPLLRGHTLGSEEDNIELIKELMETCTKLSKRVLALEESKTAQDLGDPSKQRRSMIEEINQDARVTLAQIDTEDQGRFDDETNFDAAKVLANAARKNVQTYTKRRRAVSNGSGGISTASRSFSTAKESVSTAGASMPVSTASMVQEVNISIPSPVAVKDKGKGKMEESEDERTKRIKLQQEHDRLGHEADVRLQEELDEEERQRMARVYEAAQSFIEEEWENIRARVEADEELT